MGLPQDSPDLTDGMTTSVRCGGISSCDLDGLHGESLNDRTAREFPCSISDFQKKTSLDVSKATEGLLKHNSTVNGVVNHQGLKVQPKDKIGWLNPKVRVVGFESTQAGGSPANGVEKMGLDEGDGASHNLTDPNGSQARKRLHSPINGLLRTQFDGDLLDLSGCYEQRYPVDPIRKHSLFASQDFKKPNIGSSDCREDPVWPIFRCENRFTSGFFTDGPVLDNRESLTHFVPPSSTNVRSNCDPIGAGTYSGAFSMSQKKVHSPPLSLSPLGPKWGMASEGVCRDMSKEFETDFLVLRKFEDSVSANATGRPFTPEGGYRPISTCENTDTLHDESDLFAPLGPESPTPRCIKCVKNLSVMPVRRSLVGSFEESLLSGRFSSGKVTKRIDGFLAVLNVTGGSFLPPSQKLPFGVTSVDGDSSLLYYASIDLAGSLPSSRSRGPKLKRSLSNNDSRSARSRMRIPMKGRIQLNQQKEDDDTINVDLDS